MHKVNETAEQKRLNEIREQKTPWRKWGPYLSERQWGTVREDYSENGDAWRSRRSTGVAKRIFSIRSFKTPLLSVVSGDQNNCPQDCERYRESVCTLK
jgi:hypothetical protein